MILGRFGSSEYDENRYGIGTDKGEYTLHCGDCFEIQLNGLWIKVRIEKNENGWYLIGNDGRKYDVPWMAVPAKVEI